jgi:hypothetical protein
VAWEAAVRYTVGSVTGCYIPIDGSTIGPGSKETTIWSVHDTGYMCKLVEEFRGSYRRGGKARSAEERARALAAKLNAEDTG